jgi:hypothetical protein
MRRIITVIAAAVVVASVAAAPASAAPRWWHHQPAGSVVDVAVKASGGGAPDANPGDYDLLVQAVIATGLAPVLDDESQRYTVFAPNDRAFMRLVADLSGSYPASEQAALDAVVATLGVDKIKNVLLYHVVAGSKLGPLQVIFAGSLSMANRGTVEPRGLRLKDETPSLRDPRLLLYGPQHPRQQRRDPHDRPRVGAGAAIALLRDGRSRTLAPCSCGARTPRRLLRHRSPSRQLSSGRAALACRKQRESRSGRLERTIDHAYRLLVPDVHIGAQRRSYRAPAAHSSFRPFKRASPSSGVECSLRTNSARRPRSCGRSRFATDDAGVSFVRRRVRSSVVIVAVGGVGVA